MSSGFLEKLGFSKKEVLVYESLLEHGSSTISAISKNTGLHRPAIYATVPELERKSMIVLSKKGKLTYYTAQSPEKLQYTFETLKQNMDQEYADLCLEYCSNTKRPAVKFLEGKKGISFIHDDIVTTLKKGDVYYRYSSRKETTDPEKYMSSYFFKTREKKKFQRFVITRPIIEGKKKPSLDRAVKFVPPEYDEFNDNIGQIIYGDKVAFIDYNTESAFLIESPYIAIFQRKIFKLLYSKL